MKKKSFIIITLLIVSAFALVCLSSCDRLDKTGEEEPQAYNLLNTPPAPPINSTEPDKVEGNWTLRKNNDTYAIVGYSGTDANVYVPDKIGDIPVTLIAGSVFQDNKNLTNVYIPENVTEIGPNAFTGCENLRKMTLPVSLKKMNKSDCSKSTFFKSVYYNGDIGSWCDIDFEVFEGNPLFYANNLYIDNVLVNEIVIPDGTKTIKAGSFNGWGGTKITVPDSVNYINDWAFWGCASLTEAYISGGLKKINSIFKYCKNLTRVTLGEGVKIIGQNAFCNCEALTEINLPKGVTKIGNSAFSGCKSLKSITLPDTLKEIDNRAFFCCYSLEEISIPSSVTEIGDHAFNGCVAITDITIPGSIKWIEEGAFAECGSLARVTIENGVERIEDEAFFSCDNLEEISIPESVTYIGRAVFCYCGKLQSVAIPGAIRIIKAETFSGCKSLTSVALPDSVEKIRDKAFYECEALESIDIPRNVKKIGRNAFFDCNSLKSVTIPDSVTDIKEWAFQSCEALGSVTIGRGVKCIEPLAFEFFHENLTVTFADTAGWYVAEKRSGTNKTPVDVTSLNYDEVNYSDLENAIFMDTIWDGYLLHE